MYICQKCIMAATPGNQFWKLRLKHGRSHAIATPEELWQNFEEYAEWCEENPVYGRDWKGKDAMQVEVPKMRIMTKEGFALACGLVGWEIINEYKPRSKEFSDTVTRIERYIYLYKLTGGAADLLNPIFTAKEMGLKDQQEQTINTVHSLGEDVKDEIAKLINLNKK